MNSIVSTLCIKACCEPVCPCCLSTDVPWLQKHLVGSILLDHSLYMDMHVCCDFSPYVSRPLHTLSIVKLYSILVKGGRGAWGMIGPGRHDL